MNIEVHIITCNEQDILPYALRHYATFASRIVIHDNASLDQTRAIATTAGADIVDWPAGADIDDRKLTAVKNGALVGCTADWGIVVDADEFTYFPLGALASFEAYEAQKVAVVKPYGFEMTSEAYPTTAGQIYDEVKFGARDDMWYAKPCIFAPKLVKETGIGIGGHGADVLLHSGVVVHVERDYPKSDPPCYMLHFHQIGPLDRIAKAYDDKHARMCENNIKSGWGNHEPGIKHAKDKRAFIMARLERVFP
jgi:hypothetical protein